MMKRLLICLLLCCMLTPLARAEDFVCAGISIYGNDEDFFRKNLPGYAWLAKGRTEELLSLLAAGEADGVGFSTAYCDLEALKKQGLLLDLSGSEIIRDAVRRMIPPLRDLVTTQDGAIIAVPTRMAVYGVYMHEDAWDKAALSEADMPGSYEELLSFLEGWADRIARQPEKSISVTDALYHGKYDETFYRRWLMNILLPCWSMQAIHAGETPRYDTPEFIALVERSVDVADQLYRAEPKKRGKYALFGNYLTALPLSVWSQEYGLCSALPMRVSTDQPPLYKAWLEGVAVRADSPYAAEGLRWAEYALENAAMQDFFAYADAEAPAYAVEGRAFPVSEAWMADYRAVESSLAFCTDPFWKSRDTADGKISLVQQLAESKLAPEEFARRLDALLAD